MASRELLSRLSSGLDTARLQSDNYDIRLRIARHVEGLRDSLDGSKPVTIPTYIQGYRKGYLEAVQANATAKEKLAQLQDEAGSDLTTTDALPTFDTLGSHLEVLRLRKQHHHHTILSHYASEAEFIASDHSIYNVDISTESNTSRQPREPAEDLSDLIAEAQDLTRKLEIAVLQANHQLEQEKGLLAGLKSQTSTSQPSNAAKLHALSTTRAELTQWIETSLSQCDTEEPSTQRTTPPENGHTSLPNLDKRYNTYLETRKRLLSAVSNLSQPPSTPTTKDLGTQKHISQQQQRRPTQEPPAILPGLETKHLPLLARKLTASQYAAHLSTLISHSNFDLAAALNRLRDESHLLGSYPLLSARPGMHRRTKSGVEREAQQQQQRPILRSQEDEIRHLLAMWEFASTAAATTTEGVVDKQCKDAEEMVERTFDTVQALSDQELVWNEV